MIHFISNMRRLNGFKGGFTLVEIMIVVSIIALLAIIALPSFLRAREQGRAAKFMNALRVASGAFEIYAAEHNDYPADVSRGIVPPGMNTYFSKTFDWTKVTPYGGNWDWDYNVFGFTAAVSAIGTNATSAQMLEIDRKIDDGDLATGVFQDMGSGRYSYILQ